MASTSLNLSLLESVGNTVDVELSFCSSHPVRGSVLVMAPLATGDDYAVAIALAACEAGD